MKRRYKTDIIAWPAITDLMTSIVVVAVLVSIVVGYGGDKKSPPNVGQQLRDSVDMLQGRAMILEDSIDMLRGKMVPLEANIEILQDQVTVRDSVIALQDSKAVILEDSTEILRGEMVPLEANIEILQDQVTVRDSVVTLQDSKVAIMVDSVKILQDSVQVLLERLGSGRPSCLDPRGSRNISSLMTIQVRLGGMYSVRYNGINTDRGFPSVNSVVGRYMSTVSTNTNITSDIMINHAKEISKRTQKKCVFFVRLERHEDVGQKDLVWRWNSLSGYFGGLTNPRILQEN